MSKSGKNDKFQFDDEDDFDMSNGMERHTKRNRNSAVRGVRGNNRRQNDHRNSWKNQDWDY
jgi:hypothetical protein